MGDTLSSTEGPAEQPAKTSRHDRYVRKAQDRYHDSSAEHLWKRLDNMDFINRGMLVAAILLLCFFPFMIVANALAGRSAASGIARHLGLNKEAAADVGHLFAPAATTANSVTGTAWVFFIIGGVAAATAIQDLYERAYGLEARGFRDWPRRILWLVVLVGGSALAGLAGPTVHDNAGPVVLGLVGFVALTAFWWFTAWLLLSGRVHWRSLLPTAVATGLFWLGMEVVFSLIFSSTVISDYKKYGSIGVVFALMSWLIAIAVVIILGAVVGIVWNDRGLSLAGAWRRVRRSKTAAERR
jgi:membrane protein